MSDPKKGKYTQKRYFGREFEDAKERLKEFGGKLEPGVFDYQAFTFSMPGLRLIFYPHKTSAWNYHIRVRTEGDVDKKKLLKVLKALYRGGNQGCTFQFPADRKLEAQANREEFEERCL